MAINSDTDITLALIYLEKSEKNWFFMNLIENAQKNQQKSFDAKSIFHSSDS